MAAHTEPEHPSGSSVYLTISNAIDKVEKKFGSLPEIEHLVQFVRTSERGISK